jgi:N-dimethylarginine dimethylaminohydrolase
LRCRDVFSGRFHDRGLALIHARTAPEQRITLSPDDAACFAANAVIFASTILLSSCSQTLRARLTERGYTVVETPLTAFQRSGGSACCLTLRLDYRLAAAMAAVPAAKAARRR